MDQKQFIIKIEDILKKASDNDNVISENEILNIFGEFIPDEEQLMSVRTYLKAKGVTVGNKKMTSNPVKMAASTKSKKMESKEKLIYDSYLEEIKLIEEYLPEEELILIEKKCAGDVEARKILTEGNLRKVIEIAGMYTGKGTPLTDLIQEGNIELLMFIDETEGELFKETLENRLHNAMKHAIEEDDENQMFKKRMADTANKLLDISEEYADEEGEQPTIENLARIMGLEEDEVQAVMKMSMDAMTIDESGLGGK